MLVQGDSEGSSGPCDLKTDRSLLFSLSISAFILIYFDLFLSFALLLTVRRNPSGGLFGGAITPEESAGEVPRRSAWAAAAKKRRSYGEAALDELLLEQIGESSLRWRRNKTLEEREKETEIEAMNAHSLGFPIDALTDEEIISGVLPSRT